MRVLYTGVFFESEDVNARCRVTLEKGIAFPHVTIKFRPAFFEEHRELFGQTVEAECFAYGNDGDNEGYLCRVKTAGDALQALLDTIPFPHITTSVSLTGKPVDTAKLTFVPCEPFTLQGKYGFYTAEGNVITK